MAKNKKYPIYGYFFFIMEIPLKTLDKKSVTLYNLINSKFKEGIKNDKI